MPMMSARFEGMPRARYRGRRTVARRVLNSAWPCKREKSARIAPQTGTREAFLGAGYHQAPMPSRRTHGPALALAAIVVLGLRSSTPRSRRSSTCLASIRTKSDTRSPARRSPKGRVSRLRGGEYGFGPLYALVLAGILLVSSGLAAAYDVFKAANALFFALTAVPVYLLARRLVSEWWAVLAAGLSVAIPSSISVATVMTESLAFFTAAWALYAIMLALERPSVGRQLALLAAVAAAFATRPQLGALYVTWLAGLGLVWWILPASRPRARADLVRLWPSAVPIVLAVVVLAAASSRAARRASRSGRTGSSGAATTRSRWRSGSSTTSPTSRSTSP